MCTKAPLNPKAPEWKPHLIFHSQPSEIAEWDEEGKKTETPITDFGGFYAKGKRRNLPPRLRLPLRNFPPEKNHAPPPSGIVWKPKESPYPDSKVSSDGGSPPPVSPLPPSFTGFPSCASKTTVMVKNIPNDLGKCFMLKFLDGLCKVHSLEYDFLYLPMDFRRKQNLGYAFLNLTSSDGAEKLKKILERYKWDSKSRKICETTWARIQGKAALLRRFQNANYPCDDSDFLPVILDPPRNGSDPNPPPPVVLGRLCGRRT